MITLSTKIQEIDTYIGDHPRVMDQKTPPFLGVVGAFWDVVSDISGSIRNSFSVACSTTSTPVLPILGFTTSLSAISGTIGLIESVRDIQTAIKINDFWGVVKDGLAIGAKATMAIGGVIYIPTRILQIITARGGSDPMLRAAAVTGNVGSGFFMGTSALISLSSALTLFRALPFRYELSQVEEGKEIKFLKEYLEISGDEIEEILDKVCTDIENFDEEIGIDYATEVSIKNDDIDVLGQYIGQDTRVSGLSDKEKGLVLRLICKECDFLRAKKEARLSELIGAENVQVLKGDKIEDVTAFVDAVKWENSKAMIISSCIILICVTSMTATVLSFVLTGGTSAIVISALFVLVSLGWMGVDGYYLLKQLESPELTTMQKVILIATTLLMNAASAAAFAVTGGTSEILMVVGVCALTTLLALYAGERILNAKQELPSVA